MNVSYYSVAIEPHFEGTLVYQMAYSPATTQSPVVGVGWGGVSDRKLSSKMEMFFLLVWQTKLEKYNIY